MASSPKVIEASSQELVEAQTHVWHHTFSYINSMSLKCALQLGIPDIIQKHDKPITLTQLAHALRINKQKSHALYRLMRILVHSKIFEKVVNDDDGDEGERDAYSLTRVSRLLLRDEALTFAPFIVAMVEPVLIDPFHNMCEWFRDESLSPFHTRNGMSLWESAGKDGSLNQRFNEATASDARLVCSVLIRECSHIFQGLKTMVDVGGGTGTVAGAIATAFPGLKCTVLDLPHVVGGLKGSENVRFVAGDMFESIPPAHAVFLKWIMHDWGDESSIKILKNCKEAISKSGNSTNSGKVIIVDMVVDCEKNDKVATETQLFMDMLMMTVQTGKERSEKEWATLFADAGFRNYKITHISGLRSVIEVFL